MVTGSGVSGQLFAAYEAAYEAAAAHGAAPPQRANMSRTHRGGAPTGWDVPIDSSCPHPMGSMPPGEHTFPRSRPGTWFR
jgi:hypothetical protein